MGQGSIYCLGEGVTQRDLDNGRAEGRWPPPCLLRSGCPADKGLRLVKE